MSLCMEFAYSSQTSEPSAKVTVQDGWSVSLWLSLEFGIQVYKSKAQSKSWISLLERCAFFLRSMAISTSTSSDAPTFGLQPALDRQFGVTLLYCFFGLLNSCRAFFFFSFFSPP